MEQLVEYISANVQYAPWVIFGALMLAGLNVPVSEDAMLFVAAILATKHPDYLWPLFFAAYLGAYGSDLVCFGLGRTLGPRILQIKLFSKIASKKRLLQVQRFYDRYGAATLIIGRFIPFGVRNALYLTAGFGGMKPLRFATLDFFAATITCSLYFTLYYSYGIAIVGWVKRFNIVIFGFAIIALIIWLVRRSRRASPDLDPPTLPLS